MKILLKYFYWVLTAVFVVAFGIVEAVKLYTEVTSEKKIYNSISYRLDQELQLCKKEVKRLANHIENDKEIHFTTAGLNYRHPILIFKNNKLVVWTSNKIPFEIGKVAKNLPYNFYSEREEKYVSVAEQRKIGKNIYYVVGLVPILKKYNIQNDYLKTEYNKQVFPFKNFSGLFFEYKSDKETDNFYAPNKTFLFNLILPAKFINDQQWIDWVLLILATAAIVSFALGLGGMVKKRIQGFRLRFRILSWVVFAILIRFFLMMSGYPLKLKSLKIFQSKYFISNIFCPSLGDLLLHLVTVGFVAGLLFVSFRNRITYKQFTWLSARAKALATIVIVVLVNVLYRTFYEIICLINNNYEYGIDITQNIDLNSFKIVSWSIFILLSFSFFAFYQIFIKLIAELNHQKKKFWVLGIFVLGTLVYGLAMAMFDKLNILLVSFGLLHFVVVIWFGLMNVINRFDYTIYIYLLVSAAVCAFAGSIAITDLENNKDLQSKNLFSTTIMTENDLYGEFLIMEACEKIKNDPLITNRLSTGPLTSTDLIEQKILKIHLNKYFNKYDIKVFVYNNLGEQYFNNGQLSYFEMQNKYARYANRTDYPDVYFINQKGTDKKYVSFVNITNNGKLCGYIILEFSFKKYVPKSIYPALLIDKRFSRNNSFPNYSYAIYNVDTLTASSGAFIYNKSFFKRIQEAKFGESSNFSYKDYKHYLSCHNNKCIVVSSPDNDLEKAASNFSFFFIIQLFVILCLMAFYFIRLSLAHKNINYSTKIQIYLNIAFILPLMVVTFVFMFITIKNYNDDLMLNYNNIALKVSGRLTDYIEEYRTGRIDFQKLNDNFSELAQNFETDINLYDRRGILMSSSQPLIYEKKLLSKQINPLAFAEIIEKKKKAIVINENIGLLNYYNVYTSLKSQKTGFVQGIVSIPFYETKEEIQKKLISVIVNIFNIFVIVFILFVGVTYYVTKSLTFPIEKLKLSMQNVSLQKDNQAIEWNSRDEIGQLISEYNKMILKLEQSKEQLSKTEKETAWREMAKQVAHEIKNPLTPMKLNLQYLDMMIKNDDDADKIEAATNRTINLMLEQINTLSEIATSFSNFAKMPVPKLEDYCLTDTIASVVDLHVSDPNNTITLERPAQKIYTVGDKELMGRIVNNLIINGFQSVVMPLKPVINVVIYLKNDFIVVSVKDNGGGIPTEIQHKVFLPNFSTKYTGSGLGLAMAKHGIEYFGGKIYFESDKENGTTFFIEIPVKQ